MGWSLVTVCALAGVFWGQGVVSQRSMMRMEFTSSPCSELQPKLIPQIYIPLKEFRGPWVTLSRATFGVMNDDFVAEYLVDLSNATTSLKQVPDCIRHEVSRAEPQSLSLRTEFLFEEERQDVVVNASYSVKHDEQGVWMLQDTSEPLDQAVDLLVLSAKGDEYLVYATCRGERSVEDYPETSYGDRPDEKEAPLRTALHLLGRPYGRREVFTRDKQLQVIKEVAHLLNQHAFLAAQLNTTCAKQVKPYTGPASGVQGVRVALGVGVVGLLVARLF